MMRVVVRRRDGSWDPLRLEMAGKSHDVVIDEDDAETIRMLATVHGEENYRLEPVAS